MQSSLWWLYFVRMQKAHFVCFTLNHLLALNPFSRRYLLSEGYFHGPWELKLLSSSPALNPHRWAANKKISQARISTYQCDLLDSVSLVPHVTHLHVCVVHCVWASPFRRITWHLSWAQLKAVHYSCRVSQYPLFPGSPWSMVWVAWATLVGAAHPLLQEL